jgi:hypothetical protein
MSAINFAINGAPIHMTFRYNEHLGFDGSVLISSIYSFAKIALKKLGDHEKLDEYHAVIDRLISMENPLMSLEEADIYVSSFSYLLPEEIGDITSNYSEVFSKNVAALQQQRTATMTFPNISPMFVNLVKSQAGALMTLPTADREAMGLTIDTDEAMTQQFDRMEKFFSNSDFTDDEFWNMMGEFITTEQVTWIRTAAEVAYNSPVMQPAN